MPSVVVGTSAVVLSASTDQWKAGAQLVANPGNDGTVAIGYNSSVTLTGSATNDGMPLVANAGYFVSREKAKSPSEVYLIASKAGQTINFDPL